MDLLPTQEQQQIVDTAAAFLGDEFPVQRLLDLSADTYCLSGNQLAQLADLGWLGIGLEEKFGGVGYSLPEEALLFAELGKHLMPPSILASVLAARIAAQTGLQGRVDDILSGRCKVALASPRVNTHEGENTTIGPNVSGEFVVFEPENAELVLAADSTGACLLELQAMETVSTDRCIDPTLDTGVWRTSNYRAPAHLESKVDQLFLRGAILVSALQLGIAQATLERSVTYAKEREQYGQPIGAFQAIKHYCANMAMRCESVRAMLFHASITLNTNDAAGHYDTYTAKALADQAAQENANTAVQIHGGMGYTQEMDIHLFVKRAQVLSTLFGGRRLHLRQLLAEAALTGD